MPQLLYTGCEKPEGKQTIRQIDDIPIDLSKRIKFMFTNIEAMKQLNLYKYTGTKVIEELKKLYNSMNYRE